MKPASVRTLSEGTPDMKERRPVTNWLFRSISTCVVTAVWLLLHVSQSQAAPRVVVSIKPVHSLVSAIMAGVGSPRLIISGSASPHGYVLKPSDARELARADIVIWLGPALETSLTRLISSLGEKAKVIELLRTKNLKLLAQRDADTLFAGKHHAGHGHHGGHTHHARHGQTAKDPHIWLDPANARIIIETVAGALSRADPGNAKDYAANARREKERLDALTQEIARQVAPVSRRPFLVFHDAFQYFVHRFKLNAAGAVVLNPSLRPGAKQLRKLKAWVKSRSVVCLFTEPQLKSSLINVIVEGSNARVGQLDPGGLTIPPGPEHYATLMRYNARALVDCLSQAT